MCICNRAATPAEPQVGTYLDGLEADLRAAAVPLSGQSSRLRRCMGVPSEVSGHQARSDSLLGRPIVEQKAKERL
jgi:hypothetical protein